MTASEIPAAGLSPSAMTLRLERRQARLRLGHLFWRQLFLESLMTEGTDAACTAAGVNLGQALATRLKERRFRAAWDAAIAERLTVAESLLLDGLMRTLATKPDGPPPELDKAALAAWRDIRDERRRSAAATVPGERGTATEPRARTARAPAEEAVPDPVKRAAEAEEARRAAAEVDELIARMEAGIAEAEARLGLVAPAVGETA